MLDITYWATRYIIIILRGSLKTLCGSEFSLYFVSSCRVLQPAVNQRRTKQRRNHLVESMPQPPGLEMGRYLKYHNTQQLYRYSVTHRPLEVKGDSYGATRRYGPRIHGHQVAQGSSKCARRIWRHYGLGMLQTNSEEDVTGTASHAHTSRTAEGMDLQFKHSSGLHLGR